MFSRIFGSKKAYTEVPASASALRFLGEPGGSGVGVLKDELTRILDAEGNSLAAYLRKVQYTGEDRARIALVIDGKEKAEIMAKTIADGCQSLVNIDILFFESLNARLIAEIRGGEPAFYAGPSA